jgi:flagellar basal-body rod protein FlgB
MDFSQIDVFKAIGTRMKWLNERQTVISQNVANSDTPGYRPSDLKELDFKTHLKHLPALELAGTSGGTDIQTPPIGGRFSFDSQKKRDFETQPAGNSVVLEEQMIKSAENQSDYDTMSNLYRKQIGMVKTALGTK